MALNFELKKNGFPITVGENEFFFDTSMEALAEWAEKEERVNIEVVKAQKEVDEIGSISHLNPEIKEEQEEAKTKIKQLISAQEKVLRLKYDFILGDGAFDKIYATFKDLDRLAEIFDSISEAVDQAIYDNHAQRAKNYDKQRAAMLKKKATKRKTAKK